MKFKTTVSDLQGQLRRLSLPFQKNALFPTIPLTLRDGFLVSAMQSDNKSAFVKARIPVNDASGEGQTVAVDAEQLERFLAVFKGDKLEIELGDKVVLNGMRKKANVHSIADEPRSPSVLPPMKDGVVQYKAGPATTFVKMHTEQMSELIADAQVVESGYFPLTFTEDGSYASLGSDEAKRNNIITDLDVKVKGPDVDVTIGQDFIHLFSNLDGSVQLQLRENHPLVAIHKCGNDEAYLYLLTPRK